MPPPFSKGLPTIEPESVPAAYPDSPPSDLLAALPLIAFAATRRGEFLFVSPGWRLATGRDPATALGFGWLQAIAASERERVRNEWLAACGAGQPWQTLLELADPPSPTCHLLLLATPAPATAEFAIAGSLVPCTLLPGAGGVPPRLERMLRLGTLVSAIAHEFNNLLAGIMGNSGLLRRAIAADAGARHNLERLDHAAERAATLCREISTFAAEESSGRQQVRLQDLIAESSALLRLSMRSRAQLQIETTPPPPPVNGNEGELRHLLLSLVAGVAAATHPGGRVTIRTGCWTPASPGSPAPSNETAALLEIRYQGQGFPPVRRDCPVAAPRHATQDGSGLELATIRRIVDQHRATLSVNTTADAAGETLVAIRFPAQKTMVPPATDAGGTSGAGFAG